MPKSEHKHEFQVSTDGTGALRAVKSKLKTLALRTALCCVT
jgi:hypothetical protein